MSHILIDPATPQAVPLGFAELATGVARVSVLPEGLVPGGAPLTAVAVIAAGLVQLTLSGGCDGERYDVRVEADAASGAVLEQGLSVAVIASAWVMPDGSAGWIDLIEFAARFGLDEMIAATSEDGSARIDRAYLVAKLIDAQAEIEANLAGRYALPLAQVPTILKTVIADLARARLYRRGVPDEVADQAKAQRRLLERVARGELDLRLPGGAQPGMVADDAPVKSWSGGRTYPDALSGY